MPAAPRISPVRQGSSVPNFIEPFIFLGLPWASSFLASWKIRLLPLLNFSFSKKIFIFFILAQICYAVNWKFFKVFKIFPGICIIFLILLTKDFFTCFVLCAFLSSPVFSDFKSPDFLLVSFFFSFYTKLRRFRLCSCWRFQMWMRPVVSPSYGFPSDTSTTPLPFLRS